MKYLMFLIGFDHPVESLVLHNMGEVLDSVEIMLEDLTSQV